MFFSDNDQLIIYNSFTEQLLLADIQDSKVYLRFTEYETLGGRCDFVLNMPLNKYSKNIIDGKFIYLGAL